MSGFEIADRLAAELADLGGDLIPDSASGVLGFLRPTVEGGRRAFAIVRLADNSSQQFREAFIARWRVHAGYRGGR